MFAKRFPEIILLLVALLAACSPTAAPPEDEETPTVSGSAAPATASVASPMSLPTATPLPDSAHAPFPTPTLPPSPTPTLPPIEGYWIQNTTREGLCTDSPRFIEFDANWPSYYIGGSGSIVCSTYGIRPMIAAGCGGDCPREFRSWHTVDVPGMGYVTSGTDVHPDESEVGGLAGDTYLPSFAGSGGRCVLDLDGQWQCLTAADGLPFEDVRAHGVVDETGVEWFMSEDSLASRGLEPLDQFYAISELFGDPDVRLTWLAVPGRPDAGVWVGTNGRGLVHVRQDPQQITLYTTADGLPSDEIRDVQTCGYDCVWAATSGGVGRWDGSRWTAYTTQEGLPSDDVRGVSFGSLYERRTSSVWAATAAGPAVFAERDNMWRVIPGWPAGVELTGVMEKWFSTRGHGLVQFIEAPAAHGVVQVFTGADGLPGGRVTGLAATERGVLAGTRGGAAEWDGATWSAVVAVPVNDVSSGVIGTEGGLWVWRDSGWEQVNDERVVAVAENGWYATESRVCRWSDGETLCPPTDDGRALAGARGLYAVPGEHTVTVLDGDAQLWQYYAGACDGGCFKLRWDWSLLGCGPVSLPRIHGFVLSEDDWHGIATDEGLYSSWAGADWTLSDGWPVVVRDVSLNGQTVWIATGQGAFVRSLEGAWSDLWSYISGLPDQDLSAILPLPDGSAWIGTVEGGLIHFVPVEE